MFFDPVMIRYKLKFAHAVSFAFGIGLLGDATLAAGRRGFRLSGHQPFLKVVGEMPSYRLNSLQK